ncbi:GntR family transcriptional regulator [bacterium]|nr:GntR family transcriptional regulator [bacterium]
MKLQINEVKGLDKNSPIPLYYQLKEILLNRIRNGEVKEGGFLPTEEELCREFGVSRGTVRKAIAELKEEGYVISEQGKGVFLVKPKFEQSLLRFYSIGREMQSRHLDFHTKVIAKEIIKPTKGIQEALDISEGEELNKIVRIRHLDNEPVIVESIFIPVKVCPNLLEENLEEVPLYDILEDKYKLRILKVRETLEPVVLRKEEAKILGSKVGVPAFLVERVTYLIDEKPIEVRKSIIRGDRFKFTTELYR